MYIARKDSWYLERIIWLVAGAFTIASAALAAAISPWWLIFTGLVGLNLIILSATGFCPMANVLSWLGAKPAMVESTPGKRKI